MLPDLTISAIGFNRPEPYYQGNALLFGVQIANLGNANAYNFRVAVYLDNVQFDSGIYSLLVPGQQDQLWTEAPWIAIAGTHSVTWVIDTDNNINESNEANNTMQRPFSVNP